MVVDVVLVVLVVLVVVVVVVGIPALNPPKNAISDHGGSSHDEFIGRFVIQFPFLNLNILN